MNHTPGPWSAIDFREHHIVSDSYDGPVCFVYPRGVPNEANAHLIAAAPDLLAACEALVEAAGPRAHRLGCECDLECKQRLARVVDAIAKAKGEQ